MTKFIIGIDLGTTNNVLAYCKSNESNDAAEVQLLKIPQLVAANTIEERQSLPSFSYLAADAEAVGGALDLPWAKDRNFATGEFARTKGADTPDRTVGASKSWLCHNKVDRRAPILPFNSTDDVAKISPVTAAQQYLEHLVAAWHEKFPRRSDLRSACRTDGSGVV